MTTPEAKEPEALKGTDARDDRDARNVADTSGDRATAVLIAELWIRHQPQVLERLAILERACASSQDALLTPQLLAEATAIAHKLAGSLGMFGFAQGTLLARQLELDWERQEVDPARLLSLTQELRRVICPEKIAPSSASASASSLNSLPLRA